jgi:topoisomerase-4 subunit A
MGRGFGEPLRLIVDLPHPFEPLSVRVHRPGERLLIASDAGRGFIVEEDEALGERRAGKAVLLLGEDERAAVVRAIAEGDDAVAVLGSNRKLLIFPLAELPAIAKGRGVLLQRYRDAKLADITTFALANGLCWRGGRGTRTETDLRPWLGKRGHAGHPVPRGFPLSNRFAG